MKHVQIIPIFFGVLVFIITGIGNAGLWSMLTFEEANIEYRLKTPAIMIPFVYLVASSSSISAQLNLSSPIQFYPWTGSKVLSREINAP